MQDRSIMSHIHPPKALFVQIFMILHQCGFKSAIHLFMLFLSDHFYSADMDRDRDRDTDRDRNRGGDTARDTDEDRRTTGTGQVQGQGQGHEQGQGPAKRQFFALLSVDEANF
jgi:hypothetical protein